MCDQFAIQFNDSFKHEELKIQINIYLTQCSGPYSNILNKDAVHF